MNNGIIGQMVYRVKGKTEDNTAAAVEVFSLI